MSSLSCFVADLSKKPVVSRNDSSLTLHTPAYFQTALNNVILLNKEAFASLLQTRLVLRGKTFDTREHRCEVNWKLPFNYPIISGGHKWLILTVVDNFFWKQPPDISDGRCSSFFGNNYSTFPTVIVQNTKKYNPVRYKLTKDQGCRNALWIEGKLYSSTY